MLWNVLIIMQSSTVAISGNSLADVDDNFFYLGHKNYKRILYQNKILNAVAWITPTAVWAVSGHEYVIFPPFLLLVVYLTTIARASNAAQSIILDPIIKERFIYVVNMYKSLPADRITFNLEVWLLNICETLLTYIIPLVSSKVQLFYQLYLRLVLGILPSFTGNVESDM